MKKIIILALSILLNMLINKSTVKICRKNNNNDNEINNMVAEQRLQYHAILQVYWKYQKAF